jgi:hypothetical protein
MKLVGANPTHVSSFLSVDSVWMPCWTSKWDFIATFRKCSIIVIIAYDISVDATNEYLLIHESNFMNALKKMVKTIIKVF